MCGEGYRRKKKKGKVQTMMEAGAWTRGTIPLFYFCMRAHSYNKDVSHENKTLFLGTSQSALAAREASVP